MTPPSLDHGAVHHTEMGSDRQSLTWLRTELCQFLMCLILQGPSGVWIGDIRQRQGLVGDFMQKNDIKMQISHDCDAMHTPLNDLNSCL